MKQQPEQSETQVRSRERNGDESLSSPNGSNSIIEFLNQEQKCLNPIDNDSELDIESIFEEINRLSDVSDDRSVDEILREAEFLLCKQEQIECNLKCSESNSGGDQIIIEPNEKTICNNESLIPDDTDAYYFDGHLDTISEQTTSRNTKSSCSDTRDKFTMQSNDDDLEVDQEKDRSHAVRPTTAKNPKQNNNKKPKHQPPECLSIMTVTNSIVIENLENSTSSEHTELNSQQNEKDKENDNNHNNGKANEPLPANSPKSFDQQNENGHSLPILSKSRTSRSPSMATIASPTSIMSTSSSFCWTRERALEQQIDTLRETLKDTEERLHSLRLQYDNVSQMHRSLRDANHQMHEEMERLKIDAQHLHECANILRTELQAARKDRAEAIQLQATLQRELDTTRNEKRRACDEVESNARQILDLQRQCKEMERILARKNPNAMQTLLGVGGSRKLYDEQAKIAAGRQQLEQRIAQLENDAREQDRKAQLILANVQSRFSSVQSKYETHITDLETQVLSLQQINQILNEKIEAHSKFGSTNNNYMIDKKTCATQTNSSNETVSTQTDLKLPNVTSPTPKSTSIIKKPTKSIVTSKEETQLLATVRSMRVDLAIKEKELQRLQRLNRELDECKKTIRKLQKENECARMTKKPYDPAQFSEANGASGEFQLQERFKLLEMDYKKLHEKRLVDLKTLQSAHERELTANKETVRLLEQRLAERDEAFAIIQKHNKIPIDYFALKAKVSSLERRHTEREQRLHILVEALSKGRLSGLNE